MGKKQTEGGAEGRETRMNLAALNRETRDGADEAQEAPPETPVTEAPPQEPVKKSKVTRAQIGTIPKPFTVADVRKYIAKHGLAAWQALGGWHSKLAALKEMNNG